MNKRRSLTPSPCAPHAGDVHATRRAGARHEVSTRVTLTAVGHPEGGTPRRLEGWALNVSRGGVRVILEDKVELGSVFEVALADASGEWIAQLGRIVWVQEEPDGVVAGVAFRNSWRPESPSTPDASTADPLADRSPRHD